MGKSSSQANTTTSTQYTTTTTTNIGLSGNDVNNIINDFAQFALADQQLNQANGLLNTGVSPQSSDPNGDVLANGISTSTILMIVAGAIILLVILR